MRNFYRWIHLIIFVFKVAESKQLHKILVEFLLVHFHPVRAAWTVTMLWRKDLLFQVEPIGRDRKFSSLTYGYNLDNFFTFMILMQRSMHLVLIYNLHLCRSSRVIYWLSYGMFRVFPCPGYAADIARPVCNVSRPVCASAIIWPIESIRAHG